jgi:sorbose reductase
MHTLFSLQGRTAIISGVANAGIGFAIAQILAEAGASVAILYNRNKSAIDAAETISKSHGVRCMFLKPIFIVVCPPEER